MKRKLDNKEKIHFLRNKQGQVVTDRHLIAKLSFVKQSFQFNLPNRIKSREDAEF